MRYSKEVVKTSTIWQGFGELDRAEGHREFKNELIT
jgi:hypothetical protein